MNLGFKIFSVNPERVEPLMEFVDYIEVLIVPGKPWKYLLDHDFPFRIHAAHQGLGVNVADPATEGFARKAILEAMQAAEAVGSPTVVIHPGDGEAAQAKKLLEEFPPLAGETKLLLENLPKKPGVHELMNFASEAQEFLELGYGLCLDIGHAAGAAATQDLDYKAVIMEFMKLNPQYFHVSNGLTESSHDLHLPLREGDFDLSFFKKQILTTNKPWVTVETPFDPEENPREYNYFKEVL